MQTNCSITSNCYTPFSYVRVLVIGEENKTSVGQWFVCLLLVRQMARQRSVLALPCSFNLPYHLGAKPNKPFSSCVWPTCLPIWQDATLVEGGSDAQDAS